MRAIVPIVVLMGCVPPSAPDAGADTSQDTDTLVSTTVVPTRSRMAAGRGFTCEIAENGGISCWGRNFHGEATPPLGAFVHVTAGVDYACALSEVGEVKCWGTPGSTIPDVPSGTFEAVTAFGNGACALSSAGGVSCWGSSMDDSPPGEAFAALPVQGSPDCALTAEGRGVCWGRSPAPDPAEILTSIAGPPLFGSSGCGTRPDGSAVCWGPLGAATAPPGPFAWVVPVSHELACGHRTDGSAVCWGGGSAVSPLVPVDGSAFVSLAFSDDEHACGRTADGQVRCWGRSGRDFATLGPDERFLEVETFGYLLCGRDAQNYVRCLGQAAETNPVLARPFGDAVMSDIAIASVGNVVCGIDGAQALVCVGEPSLGFGLSAEDLEDAAGLAHPPDGLFRRVVSGANAHACAESSEDAGRWTCWGLNSKGQTDVPDSLFSELRTGARHTCGILAADGSIDCWGDDDRDESSPPGGVGYSSLSGNSDGMCALDSTGSPQCWGNRYTREGIEEMEGLFVASHQSVGLFCGLTRAADMHCVDLEWPGYAPRGVLILAGPYQSVHTAMTGGDTHLFHCGLRADGALECGGTYRR